MWPHSHRLIADIRTPRALSIPATTSHPTSIASAWSVRGCRPGRWHAQRASRMLVPEGFPERVCLAEHAERPSGPCAKRPLECVASMLAVCAASTPSSPRGSLRPSGWFTRAGALVGAHCPPCRSGIQFATSSNGTWSTVYRQDGSGVPFTVFSGIGPGLGVLPLAPTAWGRVSLVSSQADVRSFQVLQIL